MEVYVDYLGAAGNGETNDAASIQAAIDKCNSVGGGKVILSQGKTYLSSSIILKSNAELHLERGAILKANTAFDLFIKPSKLKYATQKKEAAFKPYIVWIYAFGQDNISITGEGIIEGNVDSVTKRVNRYYVAGNGLSRPTLIYIENCRDVSVKGITIQKSPFWTLHPAGCTDVHISQIQIKNDLDCANNDGLVLDHCKNVLVKSCRIECADDCIVLKNTKGNADYGDCENIVVRGCELISTSAAFKIGTESVSNFRNITVADCHISKSNRGISLQLRDNGNIENVTFENINIETRKFSPQWWGSGEPIAITALSRYPLKKTGIIKNIYFSNIACDNENGILIYAKRKTILRIYFLTISPSACPLNQNGIIQVMICVPVL